jgi:hypothetical protein
MLSIIGNYILSWIVIILSKIKIETILSGLIIILMLTYVGLILLFMNSIKGAGNKYEIIITTLNGIFTIPAMEHLLLSQTALQTIGFIIISASVIIMFTILLLAQYYKIKVVSRSSQNFSLTIISYNDLFASYRTDPIIGYLKKEVIGIIRRPQGILIYLILFLVMNFLLLKVLHFSKSGTVFLCLNFPILFISKYYLHSIGQEGSYLYIIKLIKGFKKLFQSKYIIGVTVTLPCSIIYCLLINKIFGLTQNYYELFILLIFIIITCFTSVFFALCIGASFADYNVKRLYIERGITIPGEIIFYLVSWLPGTPFVYFYLSITAQSTVYLYTGIIILIIYLALAKLFYIKAIKEISNVV